MVTQPPHIILYLVLIVVCEILNTLFFVRMFSYHRRIPSVFSLSKSCLSLLILLSLLLLLITLNYENSLIF